MQRRCEQSLARGRTGLGLQTEIHERGVQTNRRLVDRGALIPVFCPHFVRSVDRGSVMAHPTGEKRLVRGK